MVFFGVTINQAYEWILQYNVVLLCCCWGNKNKKKKYFRKYCVKKRTKAAAHQVFPCVCFMPRPHLWCHVRYFSSPVKRFAFIAHWGVVRSESCSKLSGYREAVQLQFSAFMEAQNVMQLTSRGWQRERSYQTSTKSQIKFPLAGPCYDSTY